MEVFYQKGKKYNYLANGNPYFRKTITIDGKRYTVYGDGEKDALKKIEELKKQSDAGLNLDTRNDKIGATFKRWLFDIKRVDRDLKDSSFARYVTTFTNHIEPYALMQQPMRKLTSAAMQAYVTEMYEKHGASGATIKETIKVWKMFTLWALDEGYITKNPCRNLTLPGERTKGAKVIETFTAEERKRIVNYMAESHYQYDTLILLAFATGMRQGELLALMWSDIYDNAIHIERSTAVVTHIDKEGNSTRSREVWDPKTENAIRVVPLLDSTAKLLKEHKIKQMEYFFSLGKPCPKYVFTTDSGELIDGKNMRRSYERMLNRAGVPYRKFHAIRHTFATEAIKSGVDVKDLQLLMGHADIQTTYVYVHPTEETQRSAIEKMGNII